MTEPGGPNGSATVAGPGAPEVWRRLRVPLLIVLVVLVAALLIGVAQSHTVKGELDPRGVDGAGSRALATLLSDRGVEVRRVTSVQDAVTQATSGTTVFVPFPDRVPTDQLATLADAPSGARLVLVSPDREELAAVDDDIRTRGTVRVSRRDPVCGAPAARTAGDADMGGQTYAPGRATGCYPSDEQGATLVVGERRHGGPLVVVGDGSPFTNDRLDHRGNAALSLLLLGADGSSQRVVWLMSVPGSAASGSTSLVDILPPWMVTASLQLLLGCLVVAWWRGRRLGPPVVEPLPVVVRAAETVEGRARLYRRAGARDRAAEALRVGALARLVPRLGLGTEPAQVAVVHAVTQRTLASERDVGSLLFGPPPTDDAALVRLADGLDGIVTAALKTTTPDVEVRRL